MNTFENRFKDFVRSLPYGEIIDDPAAGAAIADGKTADYLFFDRTVVGELKCLEKDFTDEMQQMATRLMEERGILVYGRLPFHLIFKKQPDFEELTKRAIRLAGRALIRHFRKANNQIRETKKARDLEDATGLLILANVGNHPLTDGLVPWLIWQLFATKKASGEFAYSSIDVVIYIPTLPQHHIRASANLTVVPCDIAFRDLEAEDLKHKMDRLLADWAAFNGAILLSRI